VYLIPLIAGAPEASGYGLALSTTQIGLVLLPTSAAGFAAAWLAGRMVDRVGSSTLVVAAAVVGAVAYALLAVSHDTVAALVVGSAAVGVGWSAVPTSVYAVVLGHADADKSAVAVSVPLIFRNIGASIGVTVALVVVSSGGRTGPFLAEDGFGRGFGLGAAAAGLLVAAGLLLPGRRRSSG
jgi:MFS family permease